MPMLAFFFVLPPPPPPLHLQKHHCQCQPLHRPLFPQLLHQVSTPFFILLLNSIILFPPLFHHIVAPDVAASSSSSPSSPSSSSISDACFLAQSGFVLEGLALAVETQVSATKCKCLCALADRRWHKAEGSCQSAQYYANSGTCLLNRENRASAPERFSFDENGKHKQQQHTYLDFRCGTDSCGRGEGAGGNGQLICFFRESIGRIFGRKLQRNNGRNGGR
jgi:hypothetical protein